jgi:REP element-mobilizing transposase RayT
MSSDEWADAENREAFNARMDRIIQLLEGDKSFAGEVLERMYVEICEVNLMLNRIHCSIDPEARAAWERYEQSRGASTTATENVQPYPLMGDPLPAAPPSEVWNQQWAAEPTADAMHEFEFKAARRTIGLTTLCDLCGLPQGAICHKALPPITEYERVVADNHALVERNAYLDGENLVIEGRIAELENKNAALESALQTFQQLYQRENPNA